MDADADIIVPTPAGSKRAVEHLLSQGELQPGSPGYWRVWGAKSHAIRPGDIVACLIDDEVDYAYVEDIFEAKAHPMRVGLVVDGEQTTIGALYPIVLFRWGTHNTLA